MPARAGRTSACRTAARLDGCGSIRPTLTSSLPRQSDIPMGRTPSAACFARKMAARPGSGCSSWTTRPAPPTSRWTRRTRDVLYATTWQVLRTPWGITSIGPGGGLHKSTDGGETWTKLTRGLPDIASRQDRRHRLAGQPAACLGDGRSRVERRRLPFRRRRARRWQLLNDGFNMTARQYVLRAHLRRPARRSTRSTRSARSTSTSPPMAAGPTPRSRPGTATITTSGSTRTTRCAWSTAATAAARSPSTAGARGARSTTSRQRSSTP